MTVANFIIAGTEKAGTTSVFSYLSQHPEVAASRRKETDFFRSAGGTRDDYASFFPAAEGRPVVMEASPGYLGEASHVVPRMRALVPDVKLLFILRDPVARFLSSYHFHRGKLNLPADLGFHDYLQACLAYAASDAATDAAAHGAAQRGIGDWYLKVLPFGRYAVYLEQYLEAFPRERVLVTFYDELQADPRRFMEGVSTFLGIDRSVWADVDFRPVNVTFSGRNRLLHRLAVRVNDRLEPLLRPRPGLKSAVVDAYKWLNRARDGYDGMSASDRGVLEAYYRPYNLELQALLGVPLPLGWTFARDTSAASWPAGERSAARI